MRDDLIRQMANGSLSAEQNALLNRLRVNYETSANTDHEIINSILQELDQLTAKCTQLEADLSEKEILRLQEKEELEAQIQSLQASQQAYAVAQSANSGGYAPYGISFEHDQAAAVPPTAPSRSLFARIFRCC